MDGEEIRKNREARGWSQQDLGVRLGVAAAHISKWERGHSRISKGYAFKLKSIFEDQNHEIDKKTDMEINHLIEVNQLLKEKIELLERENKMLRDNFLLGKEEPSGGNGSAG